MNIYLLRHGRATHSTDTDSQRALSLLGVENIQLLAQIFLADGYKIYRCFASPFLRVQQTAELFLKGTGLAFTIETNDIFAT